MIITFSQYLHQDKQPNTKMSKDHEKVIHHPEIQMVNKD